MKKIREKKRGNMEKKVSRQYRWQQKQRALGRCSGCGNDNVEKRGLCKICLLKTLHRQRNYMTKYRKTQKYRDYRKRYVLKKEE
jgi:predicted amidophosphoribosyltransferase